MLDATLTALKALLKTDPALTPEDRARIVASIRNHGRVAAQPRTDAVTEKRILTRREAARRFGRSTRFIDRLAVEGIIRRVKLPGRKRACGFLAEEIERVMDGEAVEV